MTSTFEWIPGYAPELIQQPRVLAVRFGDGYSQRSGDGINNEPQSWALTFTNVADNVADAMIGFLRNAAGTQAFFWVPPRSTTTIAVICGAWRRAVSSRNANVIQLTFEQVPELGLTSGAHGGTIWDEGDTDWDLGLTIWD